MRAEELMDALDQIEAHLARDIRVSEIADRCYVSLSTLQKAFRYAFGIPVNEYILRRRFTCAARELLETKEGILEISLNYGYANTESFSRGFKRVWGITPREFRRNRRFAGHTPRLSVPAGTEGTEERMMIRMRFDPTELYDVIRAHKGNAYVCADMNGLSWINDNLGYEAGDAALREMIRRLEEACGEEDILLRIGGDEFVIFTGSGGMEHAEAIVTRVSALNGAPVRIGEKEVPLSIHIGAFGRDLSRAENAGEALSGIGEDIEAIHT